jgi:hypothetical protein
MENCGQPSGCRAIHISLFTQAWHSCSHFHRQRAEKWLNIKLAHHYTLLPHFLSQKHRGCENGRHDAWLNKMKKPPQAQAWGMKAALEPS